MTEYKRTLEDELDWSLLDQLHNVVLQTSTFCFRTKQICLTVDIAIVGILIKITDSNLDTSIFVAGLLIPLGFWFLDTIGYFYQVKIRGVMSNIRGRIENRNAEKIILSGNEKIIEDERVKASQIKKVSNAFFNHSMWLYVFLIAADIILYGAYVTGIIK